MSATLADADVASYRDNGVLVCRDRVDASTVVELTAELDRFLTTTTSRQADFVPNVLDHEPDWIRFALLPALLDPIRALIGDDIILWGSGLFCKAAADGRATPWHQDGQYWPIRPLATVTAWIAIDNIDTENGCLRVIPGSHRSATLLEHNRNDSRDLILNQELTGDAWQTSPPLDLVLQPGDFSLHDVYMIHGANPNTSGRRRGALAFRYMPATSHYDRALAQQQAEAMGLFSLVNRKLWLVSGTDVSTKNDLTPLPA